MIFSDNNKIGMFLVITGICSFTTGIFFFFERSLLLLGDICFIVGICMLLGPKGSLGFFTKKSKLIPSLIYLLGFFLLVVRWSFVGAVVQIYALFSMFRSFLPFIFEYLMSVPVIGPFLSKLIRVQPAVQQDVQHERQQAKGQDLSVN